MDHRHTNHLIHETSPYLLQHAHNPVDWYAWGEEALAKAKAEDKPILLSIGYSACHWCHVMEHESFENDPIAELMNQNFVNIKVDREERPDLDQIYQYVVQMFGVGGGWPLTMFLTPDREPFYGGTYYPPDDRFGGAASPPTAALPPSRLPPSLLPPASSRASRAPVLPGVPFPGRFGVQDSPR